MAGRLYLFAGGGTGGHLFPGIAVAEAVVAREANARILFVGSDRPIEREILSKTPFEHRVLQSVSLAGAMRHPLTFLRRSWVARWEAMRLIDRERPSIVIGCGGFASAAPVYAATRRGIPTVLLEQNVRPGRTTRWLSRLGGTVCLTFDQTAQHLHRSAKTVVTGNPVRAAIAELTQQSTGKKSAAVTPTQSPHTLLVLGGSQGATSINDRLIEFTRQYADVLADWRIVHQTGATDEQQVHHAYAEQRIDAEVAAFFDDPAALYRQAEVVVSRAGGTSLAEIACAGLPAVLLPYPHAADDHQRHNTIPFEAAGAAYVIDERSARDGDGLDFDSALTRLLVDCGLRQTMASAMSTMARPDAAWRVVEVLFEATQLDDTGDDS